MVYELQHDRMLQGLVGVVGCAKDCSQTMVHSEMVARTKVEPTFVVFGINTTVIIDFRSPPR